MSQELHEAGLTSAAKSTQNASEYYFEFRGVTKAFDERVVLNNVSFQVKRAETCVIMGRSGVGKSVSLKHIMGFLHADSGQVFIDGTDVTDFSERQFEEIRRKVTMVFQSGALFDSLTIEENVAYPLLNQKSIRCSKSEAHTRVEQALEFVELGGTLNKFPSELSGGMRRRAAIARAVVTEPPLVLYDSPTAGLDPITAHTIIALLIKERDVNHTTTLMVTNRYQDGNLMANFRYNSKQGGLEPARNGARQAQTVFMVMREGRLIFEGDQDRLEASADSYIKKFVKPRE